MEASRIVHALVRGPAQARIGSNNNDNSKRVGGAMSETGKTSRHQPTPRIGS